MFKDPWKYLITKFTNKLLKFVSNSSKKIDGIFECKIQVSNKLLLNK